MKSTQFLRPIQELPAPPPLWEGWAPDNPIYEPIDWDYTSPTPPPTPDEIEGEDSV